jgi:hypothetical protein
LAAEAPSAVTARRPLWRRLASYGKSLLLVQRTRHQTEVLRQDLAEARHQLQAAIEAHRQSELVNIQVLGEMSRALRAEIEAVRAEAEDLRRLLQAERYARNQTLTEFERRLDQAKPVRGKTKPAAE